MKFPSIDFTRMGPVFGCSFRNALKLQLSNGFIPIKHLMHVIFINTISIVGILFRIRENFLYNRKIKRTKLQFPPIFIIGHWRSGTTHLHNLLCQDPQFGFITMLEASFPKSFLSNSFFKYFMNKFLPDTRPMDNIKMGIDETQEDEMALSNIFPHTLYNAWYFPKRMMEFYYKYVRFKNISKKVTHRWKRSYDYLIRKTTFNMKGKRLLLKNPTNTARIKFILESYPEAKFIHIYRNPYTVYLSTRHFYRISMEKFMFQDVSSEIIQENIIKIYKDMMKCYFNEKKLISKNNLVEIKFEELELNPIGQLKKIYNTFNLSGLEKNKLKFENYLEELKEYKKNRFQLSKMVLNLVKKHWSFTIDKWNYNIPGQHIRRQ
ncbi:MAG: sulfotransferase [Candidatus Lokiarchaeota archaeon]|nr:sulfotransferase [Candidatus Lokiarchaeota archaeon]